MSIPVGTTHYITPDIYNYPIDRTYFQKPIHSYIPPHHRYAQNPDYIEGNSPIVTSAPNSALIHSKVPQIARNIISSEMENFIPEEATNAINIINNKIEENVDFSNDAKSGLAKDYKQIEKLLYKPRYFRDNLDKPTRGSIGNAQYTYQNFRDKSVARKVKEYEDEIGKIEDVIHILQYGIDNINNTSDYQTKRKLNKAIKELLPKQFSKIPLIGNLFSTIKIDDIDSILGLLTSNRNKQEKNLKNLIVGELRRIENNPTGGVRNYTKELLENINFETKKQSTGGAIELTKLSHKKLMDLKEWIDDLHDEIRDNTNFSCAVNTPLNTYYKVRGSNVFEKSGDAYLYNNIAMPESEDDITVEQYNYVARDGKLTSTYIPMRSNSRGRKADFIKMIIKKVGLTPFEASNDKEFIEKNSRLYRNALNIFKGENSILKSLFGAFQKEIEDKGSEIRAEISSSEYGSKKKYRNMFYKKVVMNMEKRYKQYFGHDPEVMNVMRSLAFREWQNIDSEYKKRYP